MNAEAKAEITKLKEVCEENKKKYETLEFQLIAEKDKSKT